MLGVAVMCQTCARHLTYIKHQEASEPTETVGWERSKLEDRYHFQSRVGGQGQDAEPQNSETLLVRSGGDSDGAQVASMQVLRVSTPAWHHQASLPCLPAPAILQHAIS